MRVACCWPYQSLWLGRGAWRLRGICTVGSGSADAFFRKTLTSARFQLCRNVEDVMEMLIMLMRVVLIGDIPKLEIWWEHGWMVCMTVAVISVVMGIHSARWPTWLMMYR